MQPLAWICNQRCSAESVFDAQRIFDSTICNFSSVIDFRKFPLACKNPSTERQIHLANLFFVIIAIKNQVQSCSTKDNSAFNMLLKLFTQSRSGRCSFFMAGINIK